MSRVRLVDVARDAGVDASTASRALNPSSRGRVSKQTVRRVERAAEKLGYVPNTMARGLRTSQSFVVVLVVPDITNPLFPPIVRGAERVLRAAGYTLILADTNSDAEAASDQIRAMRARGVDGFIIATALWDDPILDELAQEHVPTVLVNRRTRSNLLPFVGSDDQRGIQLCVDHLVALGHRAILHLAGPRGTSTATDRADAFRKAIDEHGLDATQVVEADAFSEASGAAAVERLLAGGAKFTAIVAASDVLALGAQEALAARGLRCPDQVSVTGYNDIDYVSKLTPPLTSVRIPLGQEGELAAETLLRLLDGATTTPMQILLPVELKARGTTDKP
jgi:LacI family transcriptional regulator